MSLTCVFLLFDLCFAIVLLLWGAFLPRICSLFVVKTKGFTLFLKNLWEGGDPVA
jgi:hypothetical protein